MRGIGLHAAGFRCHTELGDLGTAIRMARKAPHSLCGVIMPSQPGWLRKPRRRTGAAGPPQRSGRARAQQPDQPGTRPCPGHGEMRQSGGSRSSPRSGDRQWSASRGR